MIEEKAYEIWRTEEYFYVKLQYEGLQPSTHEMWLRPYFRLKPEEIVLDIGAHVGSHSLWMATRVAKVIAVEPHPHHRKLLEWNLALNGIKNTSILPFALYDKQGMASMPDAGGGSKLGDPGPHTVQFTTMDLALGHIEKLDFVKMDCEGAEAKVIRGGKEFLARVKPRMMIESHHVYENDPQKRESARKEIEHEIKEAGYEFQVLTWTEYPYAYYYDCIHETKLDHSSFHTRSL